MSIRIKITRKPVFPVTVQSHAAESEGRYFFPTRRRSERWQIRSKFRGTRGRHSSDRSGDRSEIRHPTLRIDQEGSHESEVPEQKRVRDPKIRESGSPLIGAYGNLRSKAGSDFKESNLSRTIQSGPRRRDILPITHGKSIKIEMGELICPGV